MLSRKTVVIGQMDNTKDHTFESANRVYSKHGLCPTIPTCGGGGQQPKVTKNHGEVKMKTKPIKFLTPEEVEKLSDSDLEENQDEDKTVSDYLYTASDGDKYGIFKLSPRECLRLMDVTDTDIDKMMAVNSNSRCYMQAGNSIVVNVLVAIFGQLFEGKEDTYKEAWKWILNSQ